MCVVSIRIFLLQYMYEFNLKKTTQGSFQLYIYILISKELYLVGDRT